MSLVQKCQAHLFTQKWGIVVKYREIEANLEDYESIFDAVRAVGKGVTEEEISITDVLDLPLFGDEEILAVKDIKSYSESLLRGFKVYLYTYPDKANYVVELVKNSDTIYVYICEVGKEKVDEVHSMLRKEFSDSNMQVQDCLISRELHTEFILGEDEIDYLQLWKRLMFTIKHNK